MNAATLFDEALEGKRKQVFRVKKKLVWRFAGQQNIEDDLEP